MLKEQLNNILKSRKRVIKIVSFSLLIIIFVVWVSSKWDTWFGNPTEPPYIIPNKVSRLLMTYGDYGEESRTFTWVCGDTIQQAILELVSATDTICLKAEGEVYRSQSGVGAYYNAKTGLLSRGEKYKYRVMLPSDTTNWYEFEIPSQSDNRSFIYIGDVQDDYTGETPKIFSEISERYPNIDFYLFGGDVIERPMSKYWDYWFASMHDIPKTKPILAAAGNHEYLKGFPPYIEKRFELVFPYANAKFHEENVLMSIKIGIAQILLLDSNKEFWEYPYQRRWLKNELVNSNAKWQIVTLHHPIYSTKGRFNQFLQRQFFNSTIEDKGVDLVLQAHEHTYMRTSRKTDEGLLKTPVYITSHCSPKKYEVSYTSDYSKIDNSDKYYQVITYNAQKIDIKTYNSKHQQIDKIEIYQNGEVRE